MQVVDIVLGVTSFFTIALGGLCVGMLLGLVTALITRFTKEVRQGVDISTYLHIYHHIYSGAGGGAPGHPLPGLHCLHDGGAAHLVWHHQHDRYLRVMVMACLHSIIQVAASCSPTTPSKTSLRSLTSPSTTLSACSGRGVVT